MPRLFTVVIYIDPSTSMTHQYSVDLGRVRAECKLDLWKEDGGSWSMVRHRCYELPQNPVFELRKNYINQNEAESVILRQLLYIYFTSPCGLYVTSPNVFLVLSSMHYVIQMPLLYVLCHTNIIEMNSLQQGSNLTFPIHLCVLIPMQECERSELSVHLVQSQLLQQHTTKQLP